GCIGLGLVEQAATVEIHGRAWLEIGRHVASGALGQVDGERRAARDRTRGSQGGSGDGRQGEREIVTGRSADGAGLVGDLAIEGERAISGRGRQGSRSQQENRENVEVAHCFYLFAIDKEEAKGASKDSRVPAPERPILASRIRRRNEDLCQFRDKSISKSVTQFKILPD